MSLLSKLHAVAGPEIPTRRPPPGYGQTPAKPAVANAPTGASQAGTRICHDRVDAFRTD